MVRAVSIVVIIFFLQLPTALPCSAELAKQAADKTVTTIAGTDVVVEEFGIRHTILNFISDPSIAYLLLLLGCYGIFFELASPGALFPGIAGGIFLILAFISFQTLPVNYAGLLLILFAIILFILEVKIVSHGLLSIGGIISMVMGSLMLFESAGRSYRLSLSVVVPAVIVTALFFTITVRLAYRAYRTAPVTGREGMKGLEGKAIEDITIETGMVSLHGELWSAFSDTRIKKGSRVIVSEVTGLKLKVREKEG